jgi:hypothetical protein
MWKLPDGRVIMWKLPDGRVISRPRGITVDDVNHPPQIFTAWSNEELAEIGIHPYREETYDRKYYKSTMSHEVEENGTLVRKHVTEPKFTGAELRTVFIRQVKQQVKTMWVKAAGELEYLNTFDPTNQTEIFAWMQYKTDLANAVQAARTQMQGITNYDDGVEFIKSGFGALMPVMPNFDDEEIIDV